MALVPAVTRAIIKDIKSLHKTPIDGIEVLPSDEVEKVEAYIKGPEDTPFEGGSFHIRLVMEDGYPAVPPKGFFLTKVFHPNVSDPKGEICVNTLKKDWDESLGLRHVLLVIRCLLIEPNAESALNEEAGKMLLSDYSEYRKRAALMTAIHARPAPTEDKENATTTGECPGEGEVKKNPVPLAQKNKNEKVKKSLKRL
eukprot:TRINITY_DN11592_c0_g1_i1.p2 TRINITY_DN11592_c0_g1~~TRINITY_DN11592_c0_g1_i1.p2  ORF type:complete len:216 (+),score=91.87 TRINITY_DN11592_c0_g1_i1:55-648(+)